MTPDWKNLFANPKVQVYGDVAILSYNFVGMTQDKEGKTEPVRAKSTRVYAKQTGKWMLVHANFWGVLGLCVFLFMLMMSGVLLIGLGLLVTAPLAVVVHYCVFRRIHIRVV